MSIMVRVYCLIAFSFFLGVNLVSLVNQAHAGNGLLTLLVLSGVSLSIYMIFRQLGFIKEAIRE